MKTYLNESKLQGWRAVAVLEGGSEILLFLGLSSKQIREGYTRAFEEVLDEEERDQVRKISLQRWHGAADAGRWVEQTCLNIPGHARLAKTA